ncbi:unnamed protein product [Scytosiphon promiscuus]
MLRSSCSWISPTRSRSPMDACCTCLIRVALHTSWGPVAMAPFSFAVMPGNDDAVSIGGPTLKMLDIDVDDSLGQRAQAGREAEIRSVESPSFCESRRVAMSVEALQHRVYKERPDKAVEHLAARGPNMTMSPAQEEAGRHQDCCAISGDSGIIRRSCA